ncbi:alpha/beta fold hydrolase [Aquabacter cavernae]|uniref:alpha/beta fold hydrolase n=1 Tax=Aquabacter cavernae TaxID=2496029 RepID=UPI000F8EA264|nr:hypothetical protein [Aquabacter cavernae]
MPLRDPAPTLRRHFFFVAGFDPMDADGHHRIFHREMARFSSVWNVTVEADSAPRPTATGALWDARAQGQGWTSQARVELLCWDDLVREEMGRSRLSHIWGGIRAIGDMISTGTIVRYFRFSHRYGIFFLLTYVALLAILAVSGGAGWLAYGLASGLGPLAAALLALAVGAACFFGAMATFGARMRLKQSLDLAEFSVDFVRGRHPAINARMDALADRLLEVVDEGGVDEIVIAGHSLGAMHAVSLLARALEKDPDFPQRATVRLLTVGNTSAKFALHPAGGWLREAGEKVFEARDIYWAEFQARDDLVSFYKVNPVTLRHAGNSNGMLRPFVRQVTIREMMTPATFARYRLDLMRLHCQFFLANDRRAAYDFYAFIFAPVSFDAVVHEIQGPLEILDPDGAIIPLEHRGSAA